MCDCGLSLPLHCVHLALTVCCRRCWFSWTISRRRSVTTTVMMMWESLWRTRWALDRCVCDWLSTALSQFVSALLLQPVNHRWPCPEHIMANRNPNHIHTGWARKPDCFSDLITLWRLVLERRAVCQNFRNFIEKKVQNWHAFQWV